MPRWIPRIVHVFLKARHEILFAQFMYLNAGERLQCSKRSRIVKLHNQLSVRYVLNILFVKFERLFRAQIDRETGA